ncbi:DUF7500 family protein [Halapricum hydrolyticum]|uniref:Flagella cluster protein n=1 Tax=Halapricum hydrolyticum TaxID=2979991 RepID=A0AAE3IAF5_9EURY|nr:hypothetical protein [Halapricum hydrolyticum]MCU4717142.1 hypothetical protein [Halapricum hydrolyticum]MCU4726069.1 hypothetical protein [Halapricum hydrolyticum]
MGPGDDPDNEDGRVLAPEELDISDDEHVAEIEDGRYVVSPNDPIEDAPNVASSQPARERVDADAQTGDADENTSRTEQPTAGPDRPPATDSQPTDVSELTERDVSRWLETSFQEADSRYGFHVTATFDGRVFQRRMMSNDVVTIFESLILWYAQHIDSETPVEEILGILLTESNVPITYPTESLSTAIKREGLDPDDTIADLLEALGDDGFKL